MRIVTPEEAVSVIGSGDQVYVHCAAATPSVLLDALVARAQAEDSPTSAWSTSISRVPVRISRPRWPAISGTGRCSSGPNARAAVEEGRADYVPVFLSDVPHLFDSGALPLDAVLVNATPPDAHGFCSLGTSVEAIHAAIRAARTVIVQFNRAMPRTLGDSFIHVDEIDFAVEVDVPPYEHAVGAIGDVERRIGALRRRARSRTAPRSSWGSAPSPPRPALRPARQARPRHPHRDVHRLRRRPGRGRAP